MSLPFSKFIGAKTDERLKYPLLNKNRGMGGPLAIGLMEGSMVIRNCLARRFKHLLLKLATYFLRSKMYVV